MKPFQRMETDESHVMALRSLTSEEVDIEAVTFFVCSLYGFATTDINQARYKAFMRMNAGGNENEPLARLKKINCASLPPCAKTLENHIRRAQYVARIWKRADQVDPTGGASPADFGWKLTEENYFEPDWFPGSSVPESLTGPCEEENVEATSTDDESDGAWSEDSEEGDIDDAFVKEE